MSYFEVKSLYENLVIHSYKQFCIVLLPDRINSGIVLINNNQIIRFVVMISFSALLSKRNNSFCDKLRLKLFTQSAAFKSLEIQFQSLYPRYVNERCPYDRRQRGMCKRLHDRVVLVWIWERGTNILARYFGTRSLRHLNTITASLRRSLSLTVSQLRDLMPSKKWSYFLRPNTIRAAKFCTNWSFFVLPWEVLGHTVEQ